MLVEHPRRREAERGGLSGFEAMQIASARAQIGTHRGGIAADLGPPDTEWPLANPWEEPLIVSTILWKLSGKGHEFRVSRHGSPFTTRKTSTIANWPV